MPAMPRATHTRCAGRARHRGSAVQGLVQIGMRAGAGPRRRQLARPLKLGWVRSHGQAARWVMQGHVIALILSWGSARRGLPLRQPARCPSALGPAMPKTAIPRGGGLHGLGSSQFTGHAKKWRVGVPTLHAYTQPSTVIQGDALPMDTINPAPP